MCLPRIAPEKTNAPPIQSFFSLTIGRGTRLVAALAVAFVLAACSDQLGDAAGPAELDFNAAVVPDTPEFAQEIRAVAAAQARFSDELMARDGIHGTAVGLGSNGRPVMLVLVESGGVQLASSLGGVGVRPLVTGEILAFRPTPQGPQGKPPGKGRKDPPEEPVDRTARFDRPVPLGVSTGHPDITAGTIGARVTDGRDVYALSNNHVYADQNQASLGDAVIQPGSFDGGSSPADDIGTLDDFEPIVFSTSANNVIDAAIALSSTADLDNDTGAGGYGIPLSTTVTATINMSVKKCGRTTECTNGKVSGINAIVNVNYGASGVARFVGQIVVTPGSFSAGGDSGSLIVVNGKGRDKTDNNKSVALLFAGGLTSTIGNPIDAVLTRFGVTIDGKE